MVAMMYLLCILQQLRKKSRVQEHSAKQSQIQKCLHLHEEQ